jgi:hypothetical protein
VASDMVWRVEGRLVEGLRLDVEDSCFLVINPNSSVTAHVSSFQSGVGS